MNESMMNHDADIMALESALVNVFTARISA